MKTKKIKKISIANRIRLMVIIPIVFICVFIGLVSANTIKGSMADEIEAKLRTAAYSASQTIGLCTTKDEMNIDIRNLHDYTGIDITIFQGNKRVASTIRSAVDTEMDKHIYEALQNEEYYYTNNADVNGERYFGYYIPFFEGGQYTGAVFAGVPSSKPTAILFKSIGTIVGGIIICGIISGVVASIRANKIVAGIKRMGNTVGSLLDNDLSAEHKKYENANDEVKEISNRTIDYADNLNTIITKFKDTSSELKAIALELKENASFTNETCTQISLAVESIASGAVSQAEDTTTAAQNINEMSNELNNIKANTNDLNNIATSMDNAKKNAIDTLEELQSVNEVMAKDISSTSHQVNATNKSVEDIQKAVEVIKEISNQTRLLALNASIEAARAGEHGRGFAVVAEEIGKLSNQSTESSSEIESILQQLVENYDIMTQNIKNTSENMSIQNDKLSDTKDVFSVLENDINGTVSRIVEINTMVEYLDKEITKMVDMISNLSAISEENSASTEETMASIQELTATINQVYEKSQNVDSSADSLIEEISIFKTK